MELLITYVLLMVLQAFNVACHSCGLYLLRCLYKKGKEDVQLVLVMNMSASEVFLNVTYILIFSCNILLVNHPESVQLNGAVKYIDMMSSTAVNFVYHTTMIYIAINKMLEVKLNIRYQGRCNKRKAKCLISVTWAVGFLLFIVVMATDELAGFKYQLPITYFYTAIDIAFIVIAIWAHSYLFHKYKRSRRNAPQMRRRKLSAWSIYQRSRFHTSLLLILTCIFMAVIPKFVSFFMLEYIKTNSDRNITKIFVGVLYYASFLADVFIYVFAHPPVRRLLWEKLGKVQCLRHIIPAVDTTRTIIMNEIVIPSRVQTASSVGVERTMTATDALTTATEL